MRIWCIGFSSRVWYAILFSAPVWHGLAGLSENTSCLHFCNSVYLSLLWQRKIGFSGWDDSAPFLNICSGTGDIHVILWYEQIYLGKFCSGFAAVSGQVAELRRCLNIAVISAKGECTVKIKLANALSPALNIKASIPCHSIWTITLFCFLLCFIVFFVQVFKLLFCCRIFFPSRVLVFLFVVDRIAGIHYLCAALCCCRIKLRKGKRILLPLPFVWLVIVPQPAQDRRSCT